MRLMLMIACCATPLLAQAADPLQSPDAMRDRIAEWADFWSTYSYDGQYYYPRIARDGSQVDEGWPFDRLASLAQSRNAYAMVRAFMTTGDERYLTEAQDAIEALYATYWSDDRGGWYHFLKSDGTLLWDDSRTSFHEHYNLLPGIVFLEASPADDIRALHQTGLDFINTQLWDDRTGSAGWHERLDWSDGAWVGSGKGFTGLIDGLNTHQFHDLLVLDDDTAHDRFLETVELVSAHLVGSMDDPRTVFGFVEQYESDWTIIDPADPADATVSVGHMLKTAWQLARAAMLFPERRDFAEDAARILDEIHLHDYDPASGVAGPESAWDHEHGGPFNSMNWRLGTRQTTEKDWWVVEQGFTGGMTTWHMTGDPRHLQMARESLRFFNDHFIDDVYGEVYKRVAADGTLIDDVKGYDWKAGFHSTELAWYAYLYGNLYLHGEPATVYYRYEPADAERSVVLTPIASQPQAGLHIASVRLAGSDYADFDAYRRRLTIPAGTGGVFAVTFDVLYTTDELHADAGAPVATLASPAGERIAGAFDVAIAFSEPVAGFDPAEDIELVNGTLSGFSGRGTDYQFTVEPSGDGRVSVHLRADAVRDAGGLGNAAAELERTADFTAPVVAWHSTASGPVNDDFLLDLEFTEAVTGLTAEDLVLDGLALLQISGGPDIYHLSLRPVADGTLGVGLPADVVQDLAGNGNVAAAGWTITADISRPSLQLDLVQGGTISGPFTVQAVFSEPVVGFTAADLAIDMGSSSGFAGSGDTYRFQVIPDDDAGEVTITVGSGAGLDAAGNASRADSLTVLIVAPIRKVTVRAQRGGDALLTAEPVLDPADADPATTAVDGQWLVEPLDPGQTYRLALGAEISGDG